MPKDGVPRILFIPASGPGGAGEYMRCRILAAAVTRRWPAAQIHFIVSRQAGYASEVPYSATLLDSSPAHETAAVNACIAAVRPDIVVFDSTGRAAQLAMAKRTGAACVFISARPNARRKGLRWNRIRWLDQHWVAQPQWATPPPSLWETLKKRWHPVETLHFAALFEESTPDQRRELRRELGIETRPYLLFCAGGGGSFGSGPRAADVLLEAASVIATQTALACVVVLGPNYGIPDSLPADVIAVRQLENTRLMALVHDAGLVVTGGGGLLLQALAQHKICVAIPVAGDQPERIRRCAELGLIRPARLACESIVQETTALLAHDRRRLTMADKLRNMSIENGLPAAVAALERLMS